MVGFSSCPHGASPRPPTGTLDATLEPSSPAFPWGRGLCPPGGRLSCRQRAGTGEAKVGQRSAAWNLLFCGCRWSLLPGGRCAEPAGMCHRAPRGGACDVPLVLSRPLAAEQGALKAWEIKTEILSPSHCLLVCARCAMRCQGVLSTQGKHLPFGAAKEFYLGRFVELLLFWPRGVVK